MRSHVFVRLVVSFLLTLGIGLTTVSIGAQTTPQRPSADEFAKRQIKRFDRDNDGRISRDEAGERLQKLFDRVDRNSDGLVDADELKQLAKQIQKRQANRHGNAQAGSRVVKPAATHANVAYGPHERNVLDFWKARSTVPTPLVIYIHGGGFIAGSKEKLNALILRRLLKSGISVASLNYRYATQEPLPAAHHDCRLALQFLRSKSAEWNIDKTRIGAFGGSAGAQLSMYLAFHDEMAVQDSADPIERESTRLLCVATLGGQTTMDMDWWKEHVPGHEIPHRRDLAAVFGTDEPSERRKKVADISALSLISKDDPAILMIYGMAPDDPMPDDARRVWGWKVHHVAFGVALKEQMDKLGIEADLQYPGKKSKYRSIPDFFIAKLGKPVK